MTAMMWLELHTNATHCVLCGWKERHIHVYGVHCSHGKIDSVTLTLNTYYFHDLVRERKISRAEGEMAHYVCYFANAWNHSNEMYIRPLVIYEPLILMHFVRLWFRPFRFCFGLLMQPLLLCNQYRPLVVASFRLHYLSPVCKSWQKHAHTQ